MIIDIYPFLRYNLNMVMQKNYPDYNRISDIENELSKIARYGKFVNEAPVLIAIVGDMKKNPRWYVQDTSLASMNMMLMAWSLNIGTCWIGTMERENAKEVLGLDKKDFLLTILPLGYIKGDIPKPPSRKKINEIVSEIK